MYIGKLNERLSRIPYHVTRMKSTSVPNMLKDGNPFLGETLTVSWKELIASGLDLTFRIPPEMRLNRVLLQLGEKCSPSKIELLVGDKVVYTYVGETSHNIRDKSISLFAESEAEEYTVRLESDFSTVSIENVELFGADLSGLTLYPVPALLTEGKGTLPTALLHTLSADSDSARAATAVFCEKWAESGQPTLTPCPAEGDVAFVTDATLSENAFRVCITDRVLVAASDLRGFVMGAETVLKLLRENELSRCEIHDAPFKAFRGVHIYLPSEEQMPFAKRLIKYVLSPCGYNYMIVEVGGAFQYHSHPEINRSYLLAKEKADAGEWPRMTHGEVGDSTVVPQEVIRDFVEYARSFGIEPIPEIQSLSHVQFLTLAHPEIAEIPALIEEEKEGDARLADATTGSFYAHSFCPSNPRSYEILFDLAEEILAVFRPKKYVHVGHDEVYQFGVCPVCSQKDPVRLFAEDINRLHDFYSARGLTMLMWADMLQPVSKYPTPPAAELIPKDIVFLDFIWYFHLPLDIEKNLLEKGFSVGIGNLYSSHFPRYEDRIRQEGVIGGQISNWVMTCEERMQREGKLYDFLYTAGMLWSESYREHCRYSYDLLIRDFLPALREKIQDVKHPALHSDKITSLYSAPFDPEKGETFSLSINGSYDSLVFGHYTDKKIARIPWTKLDELGRYRIVYEDGTELAVPVTYGGNVSHYARRQNEPFPQPYYRHNGYSAVWASDGVEEETVTGEFGTVYEYEWINPTPEKKILSVTLEVEEGFDTNLRVRRVKGVRL